MEFPNRLVGVVLDRFGKEVDLRLVDQEHFRVRAKVSVSGQFFGWLAGIGVQARLVAPEQTVKAYRVWLENILCENQTQ